MTTREWDDPFLDRLRAVGDDEADAVVAECFGDAVPRPPDALFRRLVEADPQSVDERATAAARWLAKPVTSPRWAVPQLVDHGRKVFERRGPHIFAALYSASLPTSYAAWRGVHVLQLTNQLKDHAQHRLTETARFVLDVMDEHGLEPDGIGIRSIRHVRLMHAAIRWLVLNDPNVVHGPAPATVAHYDPAWGVPVCQEDLLSTLLTFTHVVFDVLERGGVAINEVDQAAYLHRWCVVGHHLGILDELLPLDLDDARCLAAAMQRRQVGRSLAGAEMTQALLDVGRAALPLGLRGLPVSSMRYSIGDATANLLDVPAADWTRHLYGVLASISRRVGAATPHSRVLEYVDRKLGLAMLEAAVSSQRAGRRPPFAVPTQLADGWSPPGRVARAVARVARPRR